MTKQALNALHARMVFGWCIRVLSEHIASQLSGGSVLDVGCGDGTLAQAVMRLKPECSSRGSTSSCVRASRLLRSMTAGPFPSPDASFYWVTIYVLHHTHDPALVLAECARVARRGVVIKDHLREGPLAGPTLRLMDWVGNRGHDVRPPYTSTPLAQGVDCHLRPSLVLRHCDGSSPLAFIRSFGLVFDRSLHFVATVARLPPASVPAFAPDRFRG